jgi:hypothetical protein
MLNYWRKWNNKNSVIELHLVGDLLLVILRCTVPWILNLQFLSRSTRPTSSQNFLRYFVFTYLSDNLHSLQFHTHKTIRNNSQIWSKRHTRIYVRVVKATHIFLYWLPSWIRFKSRFKHFIDTFNKHKIIQRFHETGDVSRQKYIQQSQ